MTTTKAKFVPAKAKDESSRVRKTVDPTTIANRSMAGYKGEPIGDEEQVEVDIPHAFKLTDDGHVTHDYSAGHHSIPRSHAEHPYAIANGVKLLD